MRPVGSGRRDRNELVSAPRLLTTAEAADAFGVERKTIERWSRTGKLTAVRMPSGPRQGSGVRFYEAEVDALLAGTPLTPDQIRALSEGNLS
jgi:excisionase family DNA binding protein